MRSGTALPPWPIESHRNQKFSKPMQPNHSVHRGGRVWKAAVLVFVLACVAMNFFPHYGPPHFRYTGSDPAHEVWNLGWPLALFIYDPANGFHIGPSASIVLPAQLLILATIWGVVAIRRRYE